MPAFHQYQCPDCGHILTREGGQPFSRPDLNPRCPQHQWPLGGTLMLWIPQARFSGFSDAPSLGGRHDGTKVTIPVEDPGSPTGYRNETISGIGDIRRLERESEQRERNGEGRAMRWRDYSQDQSNRDVHTIAPDPSPTLARTTQAGVPVTVRRGDAVTTQHGEAE